MDRFRILYYWFYELGFRMPEGECVRLSTEYSEDIMAEKKKRKQKIVEDRDKLRQQILNDEEFHKCTNMQLRNAYAARLFGNNGTYPYQHLFHTDRGGLIDITIGNFVEEVWRKYK